MVFCIYSMWVARSRRRRQILSLINSRMRLAAALAGNSPGTGLSLLERSLILVIKYPDVLPYGNAGVVAVEKKDERGDVHSNSEQSANCVICLLDYTVGENLMVLSCGHCFHVECGNRWLEESTKCPLCKQDLAELLRDIASALRDSEEGTRDMTHPNAPFPAT